MSILLTSIALNIFLAYLIARHEELLKHHKLPGWENASLRMIASAFNSIARLTYGFVSKHKPNNKDKTLTH